MTTSEISGLPYRLGTGIVLTNRAGKIFGARRIDTAGDAWQMPQGGIEPGENPRQAVLRELDEETGVGAALVEIIDEAPDWLSYDLPAEIAPKVWGGRFRGQKQRWFLARFTGSDDSIDIATEHPEFTAWRWLAANEMLALIVPFKRDLYTRIFAAFRAELA